MLLACTALAVMILAAATLEHLAGPGLAVHAQQPSAPPSPPATEPKSEAIVPPMVRKAPPPAKTSVPIVPGPKGRKAKPAPKGKSRLPAAKDPKAATRKTPATARPGLGMKPDPRLKCSAGFHYAPQQLRCVKGAAAPAKSDPKAKSKPAPKDKR